MKIRERIIYCPSCGESRNVFDFGRGIIMIRCSCGNWFKIPAQQLNQRGIGMFNKKKQRYFICYEIYDKKRLVGHGSCAASKIVGEMSEAIKEIGKFPKEHYIHITLIHKL